MELIHKEITEQVIGAAYEVYRFFGWIFRKGRSKLLNELMATGQGGGLLINFGREKVGFRRLVFSG